MIFIYHINIYLYSINYNLTKEFFYINIYTYFLLKKKKKNKVKNKK